MNWMRSFYISLPRGLRWLLAANLLAFIAQQFGSGWIEAWGALVPAQTLWHFQIWRLASYLFLHGSFFHLLFNCFTLWMFGRELESLWGTPEFLKFYFFCGVGAGVFNTVVEPFSTALILGSSGAIYGILAAFALIYPTAVIYLYGIFPIQARFFVVIIGLFEFFTSFHGVSGAVARLAHLGGLLCGLLYLKSYEIRSRVGNYGRALLSPLASWRRKKNLRILEEPDLAQEVDRILEKVLLHGTESLTEKEREVMRRYSSRKQ